MRVWVAGLLVMGLLAPMSRSAPQTMPKASKKLIRLISRQVCADLCTQGLGGPPCGDVCEYDIGHNFGVNTPPNALATLNYHIKGPRRKVCPFLCHYELGDPLCNCEPLVMHHDKNTVNWYGVCDVFCHAEGVNLYGCPICQQDPNKIPIVPIKSFSNKRHMVEKPDVEALINSGFKIVAAFDKSGKRLVSKQGEGLLKDLSDTHIVKELKLGMNLDTPWLLSIPKVFPVPVNDTPIDWDRWCAIKCAEGAGGAACNCDALP